MRNIFKFIPARVHILLITFVSVHCIAFAGESLFPLHAAAEENNVLAVKQLLAKGYNVNTQNMVGVTALDKAVVAGNIGIVKLLLIHGADPNIISRSGWNSLFSVFHVSDGFSQVKSRSPEKEINIFQLLIKYRANPNIQDNRGTTAIFHAVYALCSAAPQHDLVIVEQFKKIIQNIGYVVTSEDTLNFEAQKITAPYLESISLECLKRFENVFHPVSKKG